MKNLLFSAIAMIAVSSFGTAQNNLKSDSEQTEYAYMSVKTGDELIKYKFSSIKDFEENTDLFLDEITSRSTEGKEKCEVTVEISATITTALLSTTITAAVTSGCATIAATVRELRTKLILSITH
ncbi:hypothetical protein [Flavobacterium sp. XGLA_31]|uniref:hypothetical protein n=1 Tax=Flavobacterium sp. XGLA_31 TaxID=3447666 RepID=UPI003F2D7D57